VIIETGNKTALVTDKGFTFTHNLLKTEAENYEV
jgi:hypothetical protein